MIGDIVFEVAIPMLPPPHPLLPRNFYDLDSPEQCTAVAMLICCDIHDAAAFLQMSRVADHIGDVAATVTGNPRSSFPPSVAHRSVVQGMGLALVELGMAPCRPMAMSPTPKIGPLL